MDPGRKYKESFAATWYQLCINDIKASSSISVGKVLDILFEYNSDLSDDELSEDDDGYLYGYLGGKILCRPESSVHFSNEYKVAGISGGPSVEESSLEDQFEDMNSGLHPISDLVIPPSTTSGETSKHASPEAEPQVEFYRKVITASNDMVSMKSHAHKNIQ